MPLISVVIPVYNGEKTISEAIGSVLEQTFRDFELIVIDDGSQDKTINILDSVKDSRLKVHSYPNAGLSASRNRGIKQASGEFISFLDADDLWTPDKLESQIQALREKPEAAVSYSWTDFIDLNGKRLGFGIHHSVDGYVFPELLVFFFVGSGSNALFRSFVFDRVGGFDESLEAAEDMDMLLRLAAEYYFVSVPKVQILYRVVDDSMSSNVSRQEKETLKVINRAYSQEPGKPLLHLRRHSYSTLYLYLTGRSLRGKPNRQKAILATRFLWKSFINDPKILKQSSHIYILLFKIFTSILLPPEKALTLRAAVKLALRKGHTLDNNNPGG